MLEEERPDVDSTSRLKPQSHLVDLDNLEKKDSEEKINASFLDYLKRLISPVTAEDRRVYRVLFVYLRPYLRKALFAVLLSAFGGSLAVFQLIYIQRGIDAIAPAETTSAEGPKIGPVQKVKNWWNDLTSSDPDPTTATTPVVAPVAVTQPAEPPTKEERLDTLERVVLFFLLLTAFTSLLKYVREVMMASVSRKMIRDVREDCFKNLVRLPLSFHQTQHSSRMLSRLTKDITRLRQMFISVSLGLVSEFFVFVGCIGYALSQIGTVAILAILFVVLCFIPIRIIGDRLRYRDKQAESGEADLFAIIQEALLGQKVVKAFTAEKHEIRRFRTTARAMYRRQMETYKLRATTEPVVDFIAGASIAAGIWVLGGLVLDGELKVAVLTTVLVAMQKLNRSVAHLGKYQNDFVRGITAGERIVQVLDQEPEVHEHVDAVPFQRFEREIEYRDVKFSYIRGHSRALRGINLTITKGETVAIVGASGAGKTSLVDMLPRFYDPSKGEVLIDGRNVADYTLKSLRQMIGIVSQETILFSGTIAENIAYGLQDVTREQIIDAAKAACANEFIMAKDQGYDTELGERGHSLSGGERQRIAIARALLKNPPIMILDEATSALDAESEAHVQHALENLMQGRTTIVIAHRLSTVRRANRILVIQRGEIVEQGAHDELMRLDGLYAKAFNLQMEAMLRGEERSSLDRFFKVDDEE